MFQILEIVLTNLFKIIILKNHNIFTQRKNTYTKYGGAVSEKRLFLADMRINGVRKQLDRVLKKYNRLVWSLKTNDKDDEHLFFNLSSTLSYPGK
jgi:hypothetical protein